MLLKQRTNRQRLGWLHRRWWARPLNQRRLTLGGEFEKQYQEMKSDGDIVKFFKYTRMNFQEIDELLKLVAPSLQKRTKRGLSPEHQLIITLRYLISGNDFGELAIRFRVGISTVHNVIRKTCEVLIDVLSPIVLPYPNEHSYSEIMDKFLSRWNMPNCVGAIDGKHISIQAPPCSGSMHYNYKGYFSIVLISIYDASYRFTMVDVGQYGSVSDGGVFSSINLGRRILNEEANLPADSLPLPNSKNKTHCFFVADQAFPLSNRIMRPYPGKDLTDDKLIFNYRLSRARGVIENTFGILVARWRIFRQPIAITDVDAISKVVLSAVCLHNFIQGKQTELPLEKRRYCRADLIDQEGTNGEVIPGKWRTKNSALLPIASEPPQKAARTAYSQRDVLKQFFMEDNACPWQKDYIQRGRNRNQ